MIKIKELRRRSDVLEANPNYRRYAMRVPNDTYGIVINGTIP
ncbi:hypothetical protein BGP_0673 [Beggiatoa sp. PS]|nr:hypothetical protein BGP_0673 [Beggiatoa sp. PS]